MIKQFHQDESGVAFLIFYILVAVFIFGITYSILSDARDKVNPIFTDLGALGDEYHDEDTVWGFDFLNLLLSFSVTFFVIGLIWYAKRQAQRNDIQWQ